VQKFHKKHKQTHMQVIRGSFHITGFYDVMNYQFTKLLSNR